MVVGEAVVAGHFVDRDTDATDRLRASRQRGEQRRAALRLRVDRGLALRRDRGETRVRARGRAAGEDVRTLQRFAGAVAEGRPTAALELRGERRDGLLALHQERAVDELRLDRRAHADESHQRDDEPCESSHGVARSFLARRGSTKHAPRRTRHTGGESAASVARRARQRHEMRAPSRAATLRVRRQRASRTLASVARPPSITTAVDAAYAAAGVSEFAPTRGRMPKGARCARSSRVASRSVPPPGYSSCRRASSPPTYRWSR